MLNIKEKDKTQTEITKHKKVGQPLRLAQGWPKFGPRLAHFQTSCKPLNAMMILCFQENIEKGWPRLAHRCFINHFNILSLFFVKTPRARIYAREQF